MANYSVNFWGSHPDAGNDDCHTGSDFDTFEEAEAVFNSPPAYGNGRPMPEAAFIEMDGPGVYKVRKNPDFVPEPDDDDWQREMAMQAGMAFGCDGYNDAMGY